MKQPTLALDSLREVVRQMPVDKLTASREAALTHLGQHGLPTLQNEDWKYTDLTPLVEISNRWLAGGGQRRALTAPCATVESIRSSIDALWVVISNGVIDEQYLHELPEGCIELSKFSEAPGSIAIDRPLADLNAALLCDGLRLRLSKSLSKPLGVLIFDSTDVMAGVSHTAVAIEVAPQVSAEIIEYHVSEGDADHYANTVLSIVAGAGASVGHVRIQDRALRHVQTGRTSIVLGRDAQLRTASYDLGGGMVRNDIDIDLSEPGSDIVFDGLYLAGDGQHIDNHTRVDHRVGPATSKQEYRGILNGNCRCVWNGKAVVHKGADGTDATQANHNLLLSDHAEIDAKPELEIYAEDVKCSHGTTVGQLDESALFYLRSRGLDKRHAAQVLTRAFAADLVGRAPVAAARDVISGLVEARLEQLVSEDVAEVVLS